MPFCFIMRTEERLGPRQSHFIDHAIESTVSDWFSIICANAENFSPWLLGFHSSVNTKMINFWCKKKGLLFSGSIVAWYSWLMSFVYSDILRKYIRIKCTFCICIATRNTYNVCLSIHTNMHIVADIKS